MGTTSVLDPESTLSVLALAALVLALVALSRTGKGGDLAARVKHLEEELARLRAGLGVAPRRPLDGEEGVAAEPQPSWLSPAPEHGQGELPLAEDVAEAEVGLGAAAADPTTAEAPRDWASSLSLRGPRAAAPGEPPGPPPPSVFSQIDWERWLGVRGAAVLGGAALALAGLFFFRYSIEHGLIPPWLRVVLGVLVALVAIGSAEWSLRREYEGTANALAGAGLVVLYAAFWAAGNLYGLIPPSAVFALMVVVTVAGCALSWRHESLVIAVIGLVGGFLTPFFASRGGDNPIGLFAYVLLLDAGMLLLARRMRWPLLGLLALAGTTVYQLLWIGGSMGADRVLLGLAILAVFALLFVFATPRDDDASETRLWRWSQYAAVSLPLVGTIYFAASSDLDVGILPLGALLVVLGLAAGWLARQHGEALLALGAAAATLGVAIVWVVQNSELDGTPWTVAAMFVAIAAAHHVAVELARPRGDEEAGPLFTALARAATLVGLGLLVLLVLAGALRIFPLFALLLGWVGTALLLVRQATFPGRARVQIAGAIAVGLGLAAYGQITIMSSETGPGHAVTLPTMLLVALAWQGLAILQARLASRRAAEHAAAAIALVLLLGRLPDPASAALVGLGVPLVLGFLVLLAGTRLGGGPWLLLATLATALVHFGWTMDQHPEPSAPGLVVAALSSLLFTLWPLLAAGRLNDEPWAWRAAALSGLAWFPAVLVLFEDLFGEAAIGLAPLLLGTFSVAAAARARTLWPVDHPQRTSALAWLCGAALALVTVAIPLQVDKEWITIGWALEGAALLVLWTRLDHAGLKYTALALLLAVSVRLVGNPEVLEYYPRPAWRIFNWLAYGYLVPAAALIAGSRLLQPIEVARLRDWERRYYLRERAFAAGATGLAALLVIFVWINLAIADWFSPADELRLLAARTPAEKLVLSIAWALYAVLLLVLGVRQRSSPLRWASLVLMMVTIGKIFLYDVGELTDLYRVGALLGLALSLIVVSLVYQRFVFRRVPEEPVPEDVP